MDGWVNSWPPSGAVNYAHSSSGYERRFYTSWANGEGYVISDPVYYAPLWTVTTIENLGPGMPVIPPAPFITQVDAG